MLRDLRDDGADFYDTKVDWIAGSKKRLNHSPRPGEIELLIVTALTEENQVVTAILEQDATLEEENDRVQIYRKQLPGDRGSIRIAVASAFQMGAVSLGMFVAPLLSALNPRRAVLVGIAAAVDTGEVDLGDVPFASQVLGYEDIAIEKGMLSFRTDGFQVDPQMRRWVGRLRSSSRLYRGWQKDCLERIPMVVDTLSSLRAGTIVPPGEIRPPHLVVGAVAGGPFLIRDADFRDSLRKHQDEVPSHKSVQVAAPVHPKLVSAEMEAHGFMAAANEAGIPASVVKGISDVGDENKSALEKASGGFYRAFACLNSLLAIQHASEW
ncbi:MAG: hypothetical protein K0U98_08805 [Deltaproteobacteria bacterium]|nr:hypothetical protein [Deltaproteobacteria bacterium]